MCVGKVQSGSSRVTSKDSTSSQLDTPFKNPQEESGAEIEVTDPTHPLYGRCFPLLSIGVSPRTPGHVLVSYREYMVLRIPVSATNLALPRPTAPTKLTLQALLELISLAEQCEVLCPSNHRPSGDAYPQNSNSESAMTSHPSSGR
jgi:hypothetical protein